MEIRKRVMKLIKAGDASTELVQLKDSSAEAIKVIHQILLYINKFLADSELRFFHLFATREQENIPIGKRKMTRGSEEIQERQLGQ